MIQLHRCFGLRLPPVGCHMHGRNKERSAFAPKDEFSKQTGAPIVRHSTLHFGPVFLVVLQDGSIKMCK